MILRGYFFQILFFFLLLSSDQIKSTSADLRNGAVETFKQLALKCHDASSLRKILAELIAILGGSQGKLQSWEQKCGFILAIRSLR